jgi:hypothetical protein
MTVGLILQFAGGLTEAEYDAVNNMLGFDPRTGSGDVPAGLQFHSAGPSENGWVVTEIWDSKESQGAFMASRLGPALADLPVPQVTWYDAVASHTF